MKITCTKRDDVLKRKAEYDAAMEDYNAKYEDASRRSAQARNAVFQPIEDEILRSLKVFNALDFDVTVREDFHWRKGSKYDVYLQEDNDTYLTSLEVVIRCNDTQRRDNDALRWTYEAKLNDDGEVIKETNSWSGLQATTPEQLISLRQTLSALEYINSIDWASLLEVTLPSHKQFYSDVPKKPDYISFESELASADLEDAIGQDYWIKCNSWENCPYRGDVYVKVIGETPSQFKIRILDSWTVNNYKNREQFKDTNPSWYESYNNYFEDTNAGTVMRVRKDNLHPVRDNNKELEIFRPEDY